MAAQDVIDGEVGNIVASWAIEGQHCTPEEIVVLHAVATGRLSAADALAHLRADVARGDGGAS